MTIASVAQMISPTLVSGMIDAVSGSNEKTIILLAAAMIALAVTACLTNVVATNLAASLATKFSADLRRELFRKVQGFSAAEIDQFGTASLISRNTADVNVIQNFLIMLFRIGFLAPMMAGIGRVLAIATTGRLAMVLAITIPVMIVVVALILIRASACSVRLRKKIDRINQLFQQGKTLRTLILKVPVGHREENLWSHFAWSVNTEPAGLCASIMRISRVDNSPIL